MRVIKLPLMKMQLHTMDMCILYTKLEKQKVNSIPM